LGRSGTHGRFAVDQMLGDDSFQRWGFQVRARWSDGLLKPEIDTGARTDLNVAIKKSNMEMGKYYSLLLVFVFLGGTECLQANPQQNFARDGDKLLQEGDLQGALSAYEAGWKANASDECLRGLTAIYMQSHDLDGIKRYIAPISERSANDVIFLQIAFAYSIQTKDEKLFCKCLRNTKSEWLEARPALQFGIARGAIMFFSKEPNIPD